MATITLEVFSRFQSTTAANKLLYTPMSDSALTYNHTRLYTVECSGDEAAARAYMRSVLVDEISQQVAEDGQAALSGELFSISYGIKAGALDLEKEAILTNYRGRGELPFSIQSLKITQKVYIFGEAPAGMDKDSLSAKFARDICNPAIHNWTIA